MKNRHYRLSIICILTLLAGLTLYRTTILDVFSAVMNREGSSHGVFVPFLAGYFIWLKSDILRAVKTRFDPKGLILVLIGVILPLFFKDIFQIEFLGLIVFIAGLVYTVQGKEYFLEVGFPLFFLITLVPLPTDTYVIIADWMRSVTFAGALKVISVFGISYFREGWFLQLHNANLEVARGCSGIRYLISYFVFGLAYAWLYRDTFKNRLLIVAATIPISIFAGVCRLTVIFVLTHTLGPFWAQARPHIVTSWIVFALVGGFFFASDQYYFKWKEKNNLSQSPPRLNPQRGPSSTGQAGIAEKKY